jgi:hypothetical protein
MDVARDTATVARVGRAPMLLLFIPCFHEPSKWCREYTPPSGSIIICDNEINAAGLLELLGTKLCTGFARHGRSPNPAPARRESTICVSQRHPASS